MELNILNIFFNFFENITRLATDFKFIRSGPVQFEFQDPGLEHFSVKISKSKWAQIIGKYKNGIGRGGVAASNCINVGG